MNQRLTKMFTLFFQVTQCLHFFSSGNTMFTKGNIYTALLLAQENTVHFELCHILFASYVYLPVENSFDIIVELPKLPGVCLRLRALQL